MNQDKNKLVLIDNIINWMWDINDAEKIRRIKAILIREVKTE